MSSNLTRIVPAQTPAPPAPPANNNGGCLAVVAVIALLAIVGKCSSSTTTDSSGAPAVNEAAGNAQNAVATSVAAQTLPPVQPLSTGSVRRGAMRVNLAAKEGFAGEMIYSQNCYDALGRTFTWKKLDECGGFDVESSVALGDDAPAGSEKEVAWFDGEAAAARFLKAASAAGQNADSADRRLAALQRQIGMRHKASEAPKPGELNNATSVDPQPMRYEERNTIANDQAVN